MSLADLARREQGPIVSAVDNGAGLLMQGLFVYLRARGLPVDAIQTEADRILQGIHDSADSALAVHVEASGVDVDGVPVVRV